MDRLTEAEAALVALVVAAPLAWSRTDAIAAAGGDVRLLDSLRARQWLAPWDLPDGRHWTLTALAAHRLKVRLGTSRSVLRWLGPGQGPPSLKRPKGFNPWAAKPPRTPPQWLRDELWGIDVVIFGQRVSIDKRLGRRAAAPARPIRRRCVKVPPIAPVPPAPAPPPATRRGRARAAAGPARPPASPRPATRRSSEPCEVGTDRHAMM